VAVFAYTAREQNGTRVEGRVDGASRSAVVAELQTKGLFPIQVREATVRHRGHRRVPLRRLAAAYEQFADLLKAGVPILRALELLARSKSDPRLAAAMRAVASRVSDGERLADAMQEYPRVFPSVHVAMVRAGEKGAFLEEVLAELGRFLEHQADRRSTVLGNLIYPAVLIVIGLGIVIAALVFFVPKFSEYFEGMDLPVATEILLGASAFLTVWWPLLVVLICGALISLAVLRKRPQVKRLFALWQLRLPVFGGLARALAIARFTRMLGTLLENGIPMLSAMRISRESAGNLLLEEAIGHAADAVGAGESLAPPLASSGLFDEDVIEMISVGEAANNLPSVLLGIASNAERRTDRILTILMRLMEPVLLLVLAAAVLFIFLALVVPMMQMGTQLG
jgi:general secretion pathway protein F/type IV pilus assembly protein PilC